MIQYIEYLNLPTKIGIIIVLLFLVSQIVGEIMEVCGKVVPEFFKVRKYFSRRKQERQEMTQTLQEVKQLLSDVNAHYSEDNITKRNSWMSWVNSRAEVYDDSIVQINSSLSDVSQALKDNTKLTEEMFIQTSRDRIIDFATKVGNDQSMVSREEFNRIFKVYEKYENFLKSRGLTNGEVDIAYRIIQDSYEYRIRHHAFIEDVRGYGKE